MQETLVSIITPSYGSEKFIVETIESVIHQTYQNWEMILVDDCSPDNSNEIIERYQAKDSRIKLIKLEKNSGPAVARNRAIKEANGRYVAFLDADDSWFPQKLEKQVSLMQQENVAFTYSSYETMDLYGDVKSLFITKQNITYEALLKTNVIGCLSVMYDVKMLGKHYFSTVLKKHEDYALWLTMLKKPIKVKSILEPLAKYRIHNNSFSSSKLRVAMWQWKIYREVEKLSLIKSVYYFIHYAIAGILKY